MFSSPELAVGGPWDPRSAPYCALFLEHSWSMPGAEFEFVFVDSSFMLLAGHDPIFEASLLSNSPT